MPTKFIPKEQAIKNIEDAIAVMTEAASYLRNQGDIYSTRQAIKLERSIPVMNDTAASLRVKEETVG